MVWVMKNLIKPQNSPSLLFSEFVGWGVVFQDKDIKQTTLGR